jgi:hypothetical protein
MLIFAIHTCPKHKDRIEALERTCIPASLPEGCSVQYVYGGVKEAFSKGREWHLPCNESYVHLLEKTYETIKYALNFDFEYLIKLDCDIYIPSFEQLVSKIRTLQETPNFSGFATSSYGTLGLWDENENPILEPGIAGRVWHYDKVKDSDRLPYSGLFLEKWAQGHCYVLSRRNCEILATELAKEEYELSSFDVTKKWLFEDMAVSNILMSRGVELVEMGPLVEHLTLDHQGLTSKEIQNRHKGVL